MKGGVYFSVMIRNKRYLLLWVSLMTSLCGDWFNYVASVSLIDEYVIGSENQTIWATTLYIVLRLIPSLIFSPLVGWTTDRFDKRLIMILSNLARMLLVLCYLFVDSKETLWILYTVAFIEMGFMSFYDPARRGYIPVIVGQNELAVANIIDGVTWSTMMAAGSAIGGFITAAVGTRACFIIDSCCYLFASICIYFVYKMGIPSESVHLLHTPGNSVEPTPTIVAQVEDSDDEKRDQEKLIPFFKSHPLVLVACFCKMAGAFVWGIMNLLVIEFAQTKWIIGSEGSVSLGMLLAIRGLSELVFPIFSEALIPAHKKSDTDTLFRLALSGFVLEFLGTFLQSWALTSQLSLTVFVGIFIAGNLMRTAGDANNWCFASAFLATSLPVGLMGRVFSFENANYVIGESTGTVIGAIVQTGGGIPFLAGYAEHYVSSLAFIASMIALFNLVCFCAFYFAFRPKKPTIC